MSLSEALESYMLPEDALMHLVDGGAVALSVEESNTHSIINGFKS